MISAFQKISPQFKNANLSMVCLKELLINSLKLSKMIAVYLQNVYSEYLK